MRFITHNAKAISAVATAVMAIVAVAAFVMNSDPTAPELSAPAPPKIEAGTVIPPPLSPELSQAPPEPGKNFIGRKRELEQLDLAWKSTEIRVVGVIGFGGLGKTELVRQWVHLREKAGPGPPKEAIFWRTFRTSGDLDQFFLDLVTYFAGKPPAAETFRTSQQKLTALRKSIAGRRFLIVLSGLEHLQKKAGGDQFGNAHNPILAALLREIAAGRMGEGLGVVVSRLPLSDLRNYEENGAYLAIRLKPLSEEESKQTLKSAGVAKSTETDMKELARLGGGHPLALRMLGNLVKTYYEGDATAWRQSVKTDNPLKTLPGREDEKRLWRIFRWYDERLREGEKGLLQVFSHFRVPVPLAWIEKISDNRAKENGTPSDSKPALRADLEALVGLSLLNRDSRNNTYEPHPLVADHYRSSLADRASQKLHGRLYDLYRNGDFVHIPPFPDTLKTMRPLYEAVYHGTRAGRHQEALDEVFWRRIRRGNEAFSIHKLGAFGADLAALAGFFEAPWKRPVSALGEADQSFVLNEAGFGLRALGRLAEAAEPFHAALEAAVAQQDWYNAASAAGNLSELHLTMGGIETAVDVARQGVALADESGDGFLRMANRTTLAHALHQAGETAAAEELFRAAEAMQKEDQPDFPLLYSLRGFQYCDLLLDQGKFDEVRERAGRSLEIARRNNWLLDIALGHLSLGRAQLAAGNLAGAAGHLDDAVAGLRRAGEQDELPRGLLARAALHRLRGAFDGARRDLDEALSIAERGGMRLFEADAHLDYARLHLAEGDGEAARGSLAAARKIVDDTGYHRRDGAVAELDARLAG